MGLKRDVNPFTLPDDHPGAKLRMTAQAAKDFILRLTYEPYTQGRYMNMVWKNCLLRRTHASRIPFNSSKTIGDDLPRVRAALLDCKWVGDEGEAYRRLEQEETSKMIITKKGKKRLQWSFTRQRKILMTCTWNRLPELEELGVNLLSTSVKNWIDAKGFIDSWLAL